MLPPYELRNKEFSRVMRGYNPSEVDEHINFIIEKYTELYRENDELDRKLKVAYAKLDEIKTDEESIRNAMVNAQRASAKIMSEANDRADIILNTARKSCDRILADFRKKIQEERAILIALNSAISEFKEQLFKSYNSHISFIEDIKLLDEDEIVKYALSDEGFTGKVVQNIKNDIVKTAESRESGIDLGGASDEFSQADIVSSKPIVRQTNVKDTIKEINKRFTEDKSAESENTSKTPEEEQSEKEFGELLQNLGVTSQIDIPHIK